MNLLIRPSLLVTFLFTLAAASRLGAVGSPPLITDDPGTPGDKHWEINIGLSTVSHPEAQSSELPLLDLNYGIGETWQLKFEVPYLVQKVEGESSVSGLGNSAFGVKWRFHDGGENGFAMSIYPQFEFNNPGSHSDERGLVEPGTAFVLPLQFEKALGPVTLNLQLGREFRSEDDADSWFYGVAVSHEFTPKFSVGVELAGIAAPELDRSVLVLNLGVSVDTSERTSLMASIGRELHNHEESRATFIGYIGWQLRL